MSVPPPGILSLVPFVSVENMMRIIWTIGVERMISELAAYIEEDFRRWEVFDKTPRIAAHSAEGVIELMPTSDGATYGFKYVNGHPKNSAEGLQTVTAFGVLSHVDSGYPMLISEMTILTALRTGATSALVAKYLAPPGARTMAIIGAGAQCEFQALAFKALCGVETLRIYDIDSAATKKAVGNLAGQGIVAVGCQSKEEAILGAGIVTTCTADKRFATILTDNMIGAGLHINAIGGDCPGKTELARDILLRSDIFVEYAPQTRIEGEIQQLDKDHPVTELWQVISGRAPGAATRGRLPCSTESASPSRIFPPCGTFATSSRRRAATSTSISWPTQTTRAICSACSRARSRSPRPDSRRGEASEGSEFRIAAQGGRADEDDGPACLLAHADTAVGEVEHLRHVDDLRPRCSGVDERHRRLDDDHVVPVEDFEVIIRHRRHSRLRDPSSLRSRLLRARCLIRKSVAHLATFG